MLKNLTRVLIRRVGFHSDNIQKKMNRFHPKTLGDITTILKTISLRKQYIKDNIVAQSFVNRIQDFLTDNIFNNIVTGPIKNNSENTANNTIVNEQIIKIFKILKFLGLSTSKLKHRIYKYFVQLMAKSREQGIPISSNQLERLTWFIYQQFPYLRDTKFQEICSDYTLRFFQIIQYMNKLNRLPSWQPYIRIVALLHALGHEPELRSDLTLKTVHQLNYLYYPYLPLTVLKTKEQQQKLLESRKTQQNFNIYLCNLYLKHDKLRYDNYIFYVEEIDNEISFQEIEKTIDPLTWYNYTELLSLYTNRNSNFKIIDNDLSYEMCQLFWRLHESSETQLQCGAKILKLLSQNQYLIDLHMERVIKRILNSLQSGREQRFRFFAGNAFFECFQSIDSMGIIPQIKKDNLYNSLIKNTKHSILWEQGQKQNLLGYIYEKKIRIPEQELKFLKN